MPCQGHELSGTKLSQSQSGDKTLCQPEVQLRWTLTYKAPQEYEADYKTAL